ncbi:MAG: DUF3419 domain-containing protein, partial [Mesorhizobium sp.]
MHLRYPLAAKQMGNRLAMTDISGELVFRRGKKVGKAVYQNRPLS